MRTLSIHNISEEKKKEVLSFYNDNFPKSQWSENFFMSFIKGKERSPIGYIIEINDEVAGMILGRVSKDREREFNLATLLVNENYRGRGVANVLMNRLIEEVREKEIFEKIYLHFRESNKLRDFYEKFGFNNFQKDGAYSNGEKNIIWS